MEASLVPTHPEKSKIDPFNGTFFKRWQERVFSAIDVVNLGHILTKGLQRAGPGRPARRNKAHGPTQGWPLSPLTGQRARPGWALGISKARA